MKKLEVNIYWAGSGHQQSLALALSIPFGILAFTGSVSVPVILAIRVVILGLVPPAVLFKKLACKLIFVIYLDFVDCCSPRLNLGGRGIYHQYDKIIHMKEFDSLKKAPLFSRRVITGCPRKESNLHLSLRTGLLYPLSYGGKYKTSSTSLEVLYFLFYI